MSKAMINHGILTINMQPDPADFQYLIDHDGFSQEQIDFCHNRRVELTNELADYLYTHFHEDLANSCDAILRRYGKL